MREYCIGKIPRVIVIHFAGKIKVHVFRSIEFIAFFNITFLLPHVKNVFEGKKPLTRASEGG